VKASMYGMLKVRDIMTSSVGILQQTKATAIQRLLMLSSNKLRNSL
jgi:hypothetical protein